MTKELDPYRLGKKSNPKSQSSRTALQRSEDRRRKEAALAARIRKKFGANPFEPSTKNGLVCPLCSEDCIPNSYRSRILGFAKKWRKILQLMEEISRESVRGTQPIQKDSCPICLSNRRVISEPNMRQMAHTFIAYESHFLGLAAGISYDFTISQMGSEIVGELQHSMEHGMVRLERRLATLVDHDDDDQHIDEDSDVSLEVFEPYDPDEDDDVY